MIRTDSVFSSETVVAVAVAEAVGVEVATWVGLGDSEVVGLVIGINVVEAVGVSTGVVWGDSPFTALT